MSKNNTLLKIMIGALPIVLTACGGDGVFQTTQPTAPENVSTLPAQSMEKGECITFLWAEQVNRPLIFTHNIKDDSATILINQQSVTGTRTSVEGSVIPGFFTSQSYKANDAVIDIKLKPDAAQNIYEGIKIPSGLITIKSQDGSQNIIPVSGMLGCNMDS
ncbi:hypothetical protein [Pseudemcibacter aquimaris]|uniref:hypothetical protein n=1 Tax=Pseudemcibacter aquimaris TaxID=2857064 RepID=UPI0020131A6B|nr:hypothetical protein [Pseudemcibacter aquimaris]MCC3861752.1 hypothetical protein [Pseudemcibacter aquimaris]WDU58521.1 hypothetical protein KW060_15120 [Pseudemcibacter aquimaris]